MGLKDFFKRKDADMDIDASLGLGPGTDIGSGLGGDFSNPGAGMNQGMSNDFNSGFHDQLQPSINLSSQQFQPVQQSNQGGDLQKDIQILSLKLDAIKAELDSINQRIKNIETIAEKEQIQQPKKWY